MPHQRIDLCSLYRPVTKWSVRVTRQNAGAAISAAIDVALRRPRGPVHLELASTISRSEAILPGSLGEGEQPPKDEQPSTISLDEVLGRLERSARPALVVGINVEPLSTAGPLRVLAERSEIPVLVSPKAKGIFPHDHPLFVGVATGMAADDRALEFIGKCDLIIGVGFDASEADKTWPATSPVIWLEDAPRDRAGWPGDYLVGSVPATLSALTAGYRGRHEWTAEEISVARAIVAPKNLAGPGVSPAKALAAIREELPADGVFVFDVGAHKLLGGQAWSADRPLTFFMSNGLSSMGYGVPGVIAAKRCAGSRPVVAVVGDGGFAMMVHDIETAVRGKQSVVYVVFNDESLTLIQVLQSRRKFERYGMDLGGVNWAMVAESFGAKGIRVASIDQLKRAVRDSIHGSVPVVIDVPINASEYALQI
ncbi:MAG: thiamine pyrophosphate-binding protein [Firmicutes bacterium]|nr:thiamine pyrophosphate-binding protein [Bacillota bacterium]